MEMEMDLRALNPELKFLKFLWYLLLRAEV